MARSLAERGLALCLLVVGTLSIFRVAPVSLARRIRPASQTSPPKELRRPFRCRPPSINFGSVAVGSTVSQSITISNTGGSNLIVTQESNYGSGIHYDECIASDDYRCGQTVHNQFIILGQWPQG